MNEDLNRSAREVIGEFLKAERIKKNITKYAITKKSGLHPSIVNAIESGSRDYFMSSFLTYCQQIDAYIFFGNKEGKSDAAIDPEHMISEINKNKPDQI